MNISRILSASVLAGAVLLTTTACFSSDDKNTPANPETSSTSTIAPSESAVPFDSGTATAAPGSETVAPENVEPIPDPSMSANPDGGAEGVGVEGATGPEGSELGADLEEENPDLVLTPEPDPMPTS